MQCIKLSYCIDNLFIMYLFIKRNSNFKCYYLGTFGVSCSMFSNVTMFTCLVLCYLGIFFFFLIFHTENATTQKFEIRITTCLMRDICTVTCLVWTAIFVNKKTRIL